MYNIEDLRQELGPDLVFTSINEFKLDILDSHQIGVPLLHLLQNAANDLLSSRWEHVIITCKALLDISWEKLNTGHWKDVDITWRQAYYIVSFLKALAEFSKSRNFGVRNTEDALKSCDMGILMGAPVLNGILTKLASKYTSFEKDGDLDKDRSSCTIENIGEFQQIASVSLLRERLIKKCSCPSLETFHNYMLTETPVILTDVIGYWPAFNERKWTLNYIRSIAGSRLVPIELGSKYTEDSWSQTLITVNQFIDQYIDLKQIPKEDNSETGTSMEHASPIGYLAQHQLFNQIPELRSDISIPSYCGITLDDQATSPDNEDVDINAWFGPAGTISPLHTDAKHNLLAQVVGEKYVRLYSRQYNLNMYAHEDKMLFNTSRVDAEHPDLDKFPLFAVAPYTECVLRAGEVLYIPPLCWHYVRSLSVSFSVSFWWQ